MKLPYLLTLFLVLFLVVPVSATTVYGPETISSANETQYSQYTTDYDSTLGGTIWGSSANVYSIIQDLDADKKPLTFGAFNGARTNLGVAYTNFDCDYYREIGLTNLVYTLDITLYRGAQYDATYWWTTGQIDVTFADAAWLAAETGIKTFYTNDANCDGDGIFFYLDTTYVTSNDVKFMQNGGGNDVPAGYWHLWTGSDATDIIEIDKTGDTYTVSVDRDGTSYTCINATAGDFTFGEGCGITDVDYTYYAEDGLTIEHRFIWETDYRELYDDYLDEGCLLILYARDLSNSNLLQNVNISVTDWTTGDTYSETNSYIPTTFEWPVGRDISITVNKSGYEDATYDNLTVPDLDSFSVTLYLEPLACNAPAGQECVYIKTFWHNPLDSYGLQVLNGASVVLNNQTKVSVDGTTLFYVPSSATYAFTCSKTGYLSASDFVIVGTDTATGVCVLTPSGVAPTTQPIPTTPVPVTTYGPGGVIVDRLAGIFGSLFLAALIIFTFMIGGAYGMSQFGGGNIAWIGILGGGAMGFIVDIWFGLIDFMWLMVMLFLGAMLFAVYIGKGWGGG